MHKKHTNNYEWYEVLLANLCYAVKLNWEYITCKTLHVYERKCIITSFINIHSLQKAVIKINRYVLEGKTYCNGFVNFIGVKAKHKSIYLIKVLVSAGDNCDDLCSFNRHLVWNKWLYKNNGNNSKFSAEVYLIYRYTNEILWNSRNKWVFNSANSTKPLRKRHDL